MNRKLLFGGLVMLATIAALALRLPKLEQRPMHADEAVQAVKSGTFAETGEYRYDPDEFHGPTLAYFTIPILWLVDGADYERASERTYRLVPVVFGVLLILAHVGLADGLGWPAVSVAALLVAISPSMTFYSRYYIHETLLVFFTFSAIVCGWRFAHSQQLRWAILTGVFLGLMHATKETCIIAFASMAAALVLTVRQSGKGLSSPGQVPEAAKRQRHRRGSLQTPHPPDSGESGYEKIPAPRGEATTIDSNRLCPKHFLVVAGAAVLISCLFYSSFLTDLRGPLDSLLAWPSYLRRAQGGVHDHPWHYYLGLLLYTRNPSGPVWSEAIILGLALVGGLASFREKLPQGANPVLVRFLTLYALFMTAIYAAIPYKTPWCMLGFLHGMILLAGIGAVALVGWIRPWPLKILAVALLAGGGLHLVAQNCRANFKFEADRRNPYAYGHTSKDALRLVRRLEDIAAVSPDGHGMLIKCVTDDYWPLPWYLRRFGRVGYWESVPESPDADVLVVAPSHQTELESRLRDVYHVEFFGLRPEVVLAVYVRNGLWDELLKRKTEKAD